MYVAVARTSAPTSVPTIATVRTITPFSHLEHTVNMPRHTVNNPSSGASTLTTTPVASSAAPIVHTTTAIAQPKQHSSHTLGAIALRSTCVYMWSLYESTSTETMEAAAKAVPAAHTLHSRKITAGCVNTLAPAPSTGSMYVKIAPVE